MAIFSKQAQKVEICYSRVPLMWTRKGRAKSVHISEPSTVDLYRVLFWSTHTHRHGLPRFLGLP